MLLKCEPIDKCEFLRMECGESSNPPEDERSTITEDHRPTITEDHRDLEILKSVWNFKKMNANRYNSNIKRNIWNGYNRNVCNGNKVLLREGSSERLLSLQQQYEQQRLQSVQ